MTECPGCGQRYEGAPRFCGSCGMQLTDDQIDQSTETMTTTGAPESPDPATVQLAAADSVTQPLPLGRLWSPGEPLAEPHHPTVPSPPVTAPRSPDLPLQPKRSDQGIMIALAGAACLILIVLGVALYVGGVFNGVAGANQSSPAPTNRAALTANPGSTAPAVPAVTATPTVSAPAPAPSPSPPGPANVFREHLQDLGSGQYARAFRLMTAAYRSQNPSWPTDRSAADPGTHIITIGSPRYSSGGADVPVEFYARDRHPTPGSDTQCREFQGTVHLVRQHGSWRYDPTGNSLRATVYNSSNCPS